jgi:MFS family permease
MHGINAMFYASALLAVLSMLILASLSETLQTRQRFQISLLKVGKGDVFDLRALPAAAVMIGCYISYGVILTLVPDLSDQLQVENRGMFFTIFTLASVSTRFWAGKFSDTLGRVPVLKASALLIALSMAAFALAHTPWMLYLASALFGLGNGIFSPAINAWTVDLGDPERKGRALATMYISLEIAIGGGALIAGQFSGHLAGVFYFAAAASMAGWAYLVFYEKNNHTRNNPRNPRAA